MNKGIRLAKGEWIIFLNAGDTFYSNDVLARIAQSNLSEYSFVYGNANYIENDGGYIVNAKDSKFLKKGMPFNHQSTFTRRNTALKLMFDNEHYKVSADYDMFVRGYLEGQHFLKVNYCVNNYCMGGYSQKNVILLIKEKNDIREKAGFITNKKFHVLIDVVSFKLKRIIKKICPYKLVILLKQKKYCRSKEQKEK